MYVCVQSVILSHGFASENYFVRSWLTNRSPFTFPQPKNHSWAMHAHLATVCLCSSHSESMTQEVCVHTDKTNFVPPKCIRDCCKAIWYCLKLFKHVTIIIVQFFSTFRMCYSVQRWETWWEPTRVDSSVGLLNDLVIAMSRRASVVSGHYYLACLWLLTSIESI